MKDKNTHPRVTHTSDLKNQISQTSSEDIKSVITLTSFDVENIRNRVFSAHPKMRNTALNKFFTDAMAFFNKRMDNSEPISGLLSMVRTYLSKDDKRSLIEEHKEYFDIIMQVYADSVAAGKVSKESGERAFRAVADYHKAREWDWKLSNLSASDVKDLRNNFTEIYPRVDPKFLPVAKAAISYCDDVYDFQGSAVLENVEKGIKDWKEYNDLGEKTFEMLKVTIKEYIEYLENEEKKK